MSLLTNSPAYIKISRVKNNRARLLCVSRQMS